jgi:hypothetical protein
MFTLVNLSYRAGFRYVRFAIADKQLKGSAFVSFRRTTIECETEALRLSAISQTPGVVRPLWRGLMEPGS